MKISEFVKFIGRYASNPSQIGAVCPSSRFLARAMVEGVSRKTCELDGGKKAVLVELGAGTGAVTKWIRNAGYADKNGVLYSIEFDSSMAELLRKNYPTVKIVNDSAENLRAIVGEDLPNVVAVISSLPLLSLPDSVVKKILFEVEESLPVGGVFIQFTYNLARSPNALGFRKMKHLCRSIVLMNIPPARVDVFRKI